MHDPHALSPVRPRARLGFVPSGLNQGAGDGRRPPGGGGDGQDRWPGPCYRPLRFSPSRRVSELSFERCLLYAGVFFSPFLDLTAEAVFFTLSDALFCAALVVLLLRRRLPPLPLGVMTWPWIASFVLIIGGLHVSSMLEGDMWRGVILLLQYSFCFIVLPYLLLGRKEKEAYRLLYVFIGGVIALDLHGILTFYLIGYTPDSHVVSGNGRLETLSGSANAAACLNAMMIVVVLWLRLSGKLSFKMSAVLFSVMLVTIVLTSSNGGIIAMSAGILAFLACSLSFRQTVKIMPILAIPGVFLMAGGSNYLPSTFQERVLNALASGDVSEAGTFTSRSALMQEAVDMINIDRISLLGIGADQFRLKSVQEAPVHNTFLLLWVEGGMASLLGWLLFCSTGFILWYVARAQGIMHYARAAVLASFIVFIVVANVSAHIYARYWYTALLLIMQPTLIGLSLHFLKSERFAQAFRQRFTRSNRRLVRRW
jgi:hypothetical protein